MRARTIIQLSVALGLALMAGWLVYQWMLAAENRSRAVAEKKPEIYVVVAASDLKRGTKLGTAHLKRVPFYAESAPAQAFDQVDELVGRVLLTPMQVNEPVTEARLASENVQDGGIGVMITAGKRAIAVKGNKVLGMSGLIHPGNRVDVLVTLVDDQLPTGVMTKTVLENIHVLATGGELEQREKDDGSAPMETYTLEITPAQAELLALAATQGTLHFALRNPSDDSHILTRGANVKTTLAALAPKPKAVIRKVARPKPAAPKPVKKPEFVVEVIRGGDSEQISFAQGADHAVQ